MNQSWLQSQFWPEIAVDGSNQEPVLDTPLRMLTDTRRCVLVILKEPLRHGPKDPHLARSC